MQGTKENRQVATSGNQPLRREESRREEYVAPQVNIFENKEGYVLEAEMPGVNKEGLEITLEENEITIVGHRQAESTPGQPMRSGLRRMRASTMATKRKAKKLRQKTSSNGVARST